MLERKVHLSAKRTISSLKLIYRNKKEKKNPVHSKKNGYFFPRIFRNILEIKIIRKFHGNIRKRFSYEYTAKRYFLPETSKEKLKINDSFSS